MLTVSNVNIGQYFQLLVNSLTIKTVNKHRHVADYFVVGPSKHFNHCTAVDVAIEYQLRVNPDDQFGIFDIETLILTLTSTLMLILMFDVNSFVNIDIDIIIVWGRVSLVARALD